MSKIFYYELKRMLLNKVFPAMLLLNGLFACFVLSTDIIRGVACTAPFSGWSYCAYLGKTLPLAAVTVLLLLSAYYGKKQRQLEVLTLTTPVTAARQMLLRTAAAGVCFALIFLLITVLAAVFYRAFFRYTDFAAFLLPSLLLALPCFLLPTGLGQLLAGLHRSLIYALSAIVLAAAYCGPPTVLDLFGARYFSAYPLTLPVGAGGEPPFALTAAFCAVRLLYLAAGAVCIYFTAMLTARKSRKA
ncbi:MAG: hypothetical protein NC337_02560 [Roseburia sp.]|nr:hypothetical protein [Roseburia sp.]